MIFISNGVYDKNKPRALFDNLYSRVGAVVSGDADALFPVGNAVNATTFDHWKYTSGDANGQVVLLASEAADCAFIGAHKLGTNGADVKIQYSTNGGAVWLDATEWEAPTDDSPIMFIFPEKTGNAWRVSVRNGNTDIGVVLIGLSLVFPNGIDGNYTSFQHGKKYEILGGTSLGGQFIGQQVQKKGGKTSISFPLLSADFVDNDMVGFELHYNEGKPFGWASNPAFRDADTAYCWRGESDGELSPSYLENGLYENFTMNVEYYVD